MRIALAVAAAAALVAGQDGADRKGADDESRLEASVEVAAPVEKAWEAFTTGEGIRAWMVPHGEIELKVGGLMRTNYHADGKLGDPNTIENTILSFDPLRMLSIKATKAPASFPFKAAIASMWSVMYFERLGEAKTRVTVVGLGYGRDAESQKMRAFFKQGNAMTLERLKKHLEK